MKKKSVMNCSVLVYSHNPGLFVLLTQEIEVTKLVPLERLVLHRFPLVCVRIRSELRGLIVSNRVTLTLPCASAIARSMQDSVAKFVLVTWLHPRYDVQEVQCDCRHLL